MENAAFRSVGTFSSLENGNIQVAKGLIVMIGNRPELRRLKTAYGPAVCSLAERADRPPNGPALTSPFWVWFFFYSTFITIIIIPQMHPVVGSAQIY